MTIVGTDVRYACLWHMEYDLGASLLQPVMALGLHYTMDILRELLSAENILKRSSSAKSSWKI